MRRAKFVVARGWFWRLERHRLKTKIGVAPLLCNPDDPGTLSHSDEEKADILQSQFCSVFTREPEGEIPQLEPRIGERLERLVITHDWVLKALMKTNITKSCGPDELHPRMLKELAVELAAPMTVQPEFISGRSPRGVENGKCISNLQEGE